tara:strand:+ start:6862 stop:7602 length:741 start_codon:yes stop_codon:yes gene_type:complete
MRWAVDGDILLYAVAYAAKDDPVSYACRSVRAACQDVMYAVNAEAIDIYLTGSGNYRAEYGDTTYPYKGTRLSEKPAHFTELKRYMIEEMGAILIEGEEADDRMGIDATQYGHGIATIDKDLNGIAGWHYRWKIRGKDAVVYNVSPEEADRFFYLQLLTGDATDNIPGLFKRLGRKVTAPIKEPLQYLHTPEEMYAYVRGIYSEAYDKVGMCLDDKDEVIDNWILKQARCLWIRREDDEMWEPPHA